MEHNTGKKRKLQGNAPEGEFTSPHGLDQSECENVCSMHIGERLGKLEQLFEKFVCRKTSNADILSDSQSSISTLVNENPSYSSYLPQIPTDSHSIKSIGEGIVSISLFSSPLDDFVLIPRRSSYTTHGHHRLLSGH